MAGIGVQVEVNIGGLGWTDVTADVRTSDQIKINGGRRDEASAVTPGTCTFKLNNRDGVYSDFNPMSPYYGLLGRNTPLRVSVPGPESYLQLDGSVDDFASTPYTPAMDPVGVLDIRAEVTMDWQNQFASQTLIGRWDPETDQRCWVLRVYQGLITFSVSSDGTWATQYGWSWYLPAELPERAAIRAVFDPAASSLSYYWAASLDGPWTQLLEPTVVSGGSMFTGATSGLTVAPYDPKATPFRRPFEGDGHRFEVYQGGVLIASPDFRALTPGTTAFTDAAGLDWTVTGDARVTDRAYRFTGEVSAWPQRWDVAGVDVWVPLSAAGVLRRYGQGTKPLQSTLRRRIPSASPTPVGYWPMEEGTEAAHASSPLPGVRALSTSGMQWASNSDIPASAPLPTLGQQSSLRADVPASMADGWHVELVYEAEKVPSTVQPLLRVYSSGSKVAYAEASLGPDVVRVRAYDSDDVMVAGIDGAYPDVVAAFPGHASRMQFFSGVDTAGRGYWAIAWRDVSSDIFYYTYTSVDGVTPGHITRVTGSWGEDFQGMTIGHLGVFDVPGGTDVRPTVNVYDGADDAFAGETTIGRMRRLSGEEQLPLHIVGDPAQTELVGPQRVDTILKTVQAAADVDGGLLHEQRDSLVLAYRARHTLYNQPVALALDYTARGEVMPPLEPTEDDQATRNDVTMTREGGSSAQSVQETGPLSIQDPPAGVGRYDTEITVNAYSDWQLLDLAGWAVHLGTWAGARYPSVHIALHAAPWLTQQVLAMRLLDRIQIANPPPWLPPGVIDLLAEGYTEILGPYTWDITFNCSPAGPWTVGVVGDDVLGRADTDGTVLADAVGSDDTVLPVRVTAGAQWTTDPAEFPFDLRVGGEVVTATACSTAQGTPMPAGVDSTTDTTGATAIAPSVDADEAGDLLVCAWVPWDGVQAYTPPASMTRQTDTAGVWSVLTDATETLAAGGATGTRTATRTANTAWAALSVAAAGAPVIEEHLADIASDAAKTHAPGPVTHTTAAGTQAGWWLVALHGFDNAGGTASAAPDGAGWIELAVSGYGNASKPFMGAWVKRAVGGAETVTYPQGAADDNHARLYVVSGATDLSAQLMTVVRAVNGITKPQAAGSDVRLAQPSIVAL